MFLSEFKYLTRERESHAKFLSEFKYLKRERERESC